MYCNINSDSKGYSNGNSHNNDSSNNNSDGNMRIDAVPHGPPSNVWMEAGHTADDVDKMTMTR